ncbi:relaxase/mobilization nuclease domain-containing protein [Bacteroides caecigallinarum]|nr:relaxase/mobilization nuclease domain-containing protein [Bacteroides caecigallinarum]
MAVAAVVAVFFSLSVRISDFTCFSSCSARFICSSLCRFAASMRCSSAFCFSMIKSLRSRCSLPKEPDKSKYEIYTAVRNEIGKSKSWRQLQERLAEKGIGIRFKYKGRTDEVQGISFTKGAYTFKGSEIDRNFSFSKLDKHFGNAGMDTVENSRQQIVSAPILEPEQTPQRNDSPSMGGLFSLFDVSPSAPSDEEIDWSLRKKKKKKKRQLKL